MTINVTQSQRAALPSSPQEFSLLIGDRFIPVSQRSTIERRNPAHDALVSRYPLATIEDVGAAVEAARKAADARVWSGMSGAERARALLKVAHAIDARRDELKLIECLEVGKPYGLVDREINATIGLWEYAATLARHCYGDTYDQLGSQTMGLVFRQPVGVVGMIVPWNYPLLIASQKLPFALAVGCTAVLKPSEMTSGSALRLGEILIEAGVPPGVVNIVAGYGADVGRAITTHPSVDMVSFTGSTKVGREVGRIAPGFTANVRPARASVRPYRLVKPWTWIMSASLAERGWPTHRSRGWSLRSYLGLTPFEGGPG